MLATMIGVAATTVVTVAGYLKSRQFVRDRLRYVDAAQSPVAPVVAGVGATVIAGLIVAFLPVVGIGTALLFGAGVGVGVAAGARDIKGGLPAIRD